MEIKSPRLIGFGLFIGLLYLSFNSTQAFILFSRELKYIRSPQQNMIKDTKNLSVFSFLCAQLEKKETLHLRSQCYSDKIFQKLNLTLWGLPY